MGKVKQRQKNRHHHDNPNRVTKNSGKRQYSQRVPQHVRDKFSNSVKSKSIGKHQPQAKVKVPFQEWDSILLVGEGDFSFALSLARNYKVRSITATSFDTREILEQKHPAIDETLSKLHEFPNREISHLSSDQSEDPTTSNDWEGFSVSSERSDASLSDSGSTNDGKIIHVNVLHGIDATKLSTTHKKALRRHIPFTKIVFNLPHVGGLSKDVNRQVRANQELLVGFFNAAKPLLATPSRPARRRKRDIDAGCGQDANDIDSSKETDNLTKGLIIVTLFEGEPYTLWNIRDLARHCGLQVVESFKFPWTAYPGYQHARTIGDITYGKDRSEDGTRKGAWRGEERDARSYVLGLKDTKDAGQQLFKKRKRKGDEDSESD